MSWLICKDTHVHANKVSLEFDRKFAGKTPQAEDLKIVDELYESTALVAPTHPTNVKLNSTLHTDLTKVPKHHFVRKTRKSDGAHYTELCYSLLVEVQSGPMKFSLEVDGKEYSAVDADY
ncbi:Hsp70 family protein [Botryosphaeria dothidea]|uniref:Hsp70 family protein n=1 Tax=Botryosphaeria dothidea TaxID=55169 RepID=A0A8H4N5T1_9PEZI|nr:Hsp70 family protein [Botryosphaeria dothidea]